MGQPGVLHAAVVGVPDEGLGERICAFVVLRRGAEAATLGEVTDFLSGRGVARNKLPERLEVLAELPITPTGKILKRVLRDVIAQTLAHEQGRAEAAGGGQ